MPAEIIEENENELVIKVVIPKGENFLDCEERIQKHVSMAGKVATQHFLENFDTDGSPLIVGHQKLTAKRKKVLKKYETPFGTISVNRFVYQSSQGGTTFVPLDKSARIIGNSTPRFAKLISFKYSHTNAGVVQQDLIQTLHRKVSRCYIQDISTRVADGIDSKAANWDFTSTQPLPSEVAVISIGLDGTCLYYKDEGYREAMVGTIAFHDAAGDRLHTIYVAASPEYGKATFLSRMDSEIEKVKSRYGKDGEIRYIGISDGANGYKPWLKKHTAFQILDFWHLTEYLGEASKAMSSSVEGQLEWLEGKCHQLKHKFKAAKVILEELKKASEDENISESAMESLNKTITYMSNQKGRMNYASYRRQHFPIGSGITEAGCKTVVKQRMCGSGMKWKERGADAVLRLRTMTLTKGVWESFWLQVAKFGI